MPSNSKNIAELLNTDTTVQIADVADGAITTAKLAADAVTSAKLADNSVVTANIVDGNVTAVKTTGVSKGKNLLINGGFDIWQRGTSHTSTSTNEYSADRFRTEGNALSTTISRQAFAAGQTDVPNFPTYYARVATSAKPSSGQYWALMQRIEAPLNARQGQTYTLSYWVRSTSGTVAASAFTYGFGGSGSVRSNSPALTTTWQKVTSTQTNINVSGGGTYLSVYIMHVPDTAPSSMSVEIANVKVEEGNVATDFEHRLYGEELALCQRYYWQTADVQFFNYGGAGQLHCTAFNPVEMRTTPTMTLYPTQNDLVNKTNSGNCTKDGTGNISVSGLQNNKFHTACFVGSGQGTNHRVARTCDSEL